MVLELVCPSCEPMEVNTHAMTGWYDLVFDEELGSQPCIFTSVTPVNNVLPPLSPIIRVESVLIRHGTMST